MESVRVMLVDDHQVVRTGIKVYLESQPEIQVVGEAGTGEEALESIAALKPDVVVMDITMPGMGGIEATRLLAAQYPSCHVLILTVHADPQYFFEMMAAGATGYVTKQAAADELLEAIRTVSRGQVYLQPALARWLLDDYRRLSKQCDQQNPPTAVSQAHITDLDVLSRRERQVLQFVADGLSSIEISEKLGISPKTVSRHRERIMNKLNIHSATELVKFSVRAGLIEIK